MKKKKEHIRTLKNGKKIIVNKGQAQMTGKKIRETESLSRSFRNFVYPTTLAIGEGRRALNWINKLRGNSQAKSVKQQLSDLGSSARSIRNIQRIF